MASPASIAAQGYWGEPTSTIDWCESNYLLTPYVAEVFNSASSFFIVAAGALPLLLHGELWPILEWRFLLAFLSVVVVGLGSVAFHGTLRFEHQMWDEVPMLWTVAVLLYCLFEQDSPQPVCGVTLPVGLAVYATVATYATSQQGGNAQWFSFHTFFALAEFLGLFKVIQFFRRIDGGQQPLRSLMRWGFAAYIGAIIVWLADLNFCLRLQTLPGYDCWNLHAFGWHLLVSCGLYAMIVGIWYHRLKCVLGFDVTLVVGLVPHVRRNPKEA